MKLTLDTRINEHVFIANNFIIDVTLLISIITLNRLSRINYIYYSIIIHKI